MGNIICKSNKDIPQEMLLGNLCFTSLTDMLLPEYTVTNIFQSNSIPEYYVRKISKADAFRRATSSIKNEIITFVDQSTGNLIKAKIEVDEVKSDKDGIKRIIGFKSVDRANEDIAYTPVGYIIFDRDTETITDNITNPYDTVAEVLGLFKDVSNKYNTWSIYHNKDTIKNIVNRIILDTHPINLMSTGLCKFTPQQSADLLYNLQNALKELNPNNTMELIPVIDTEEQRDLIKRNASSEINNELYAFTQELREVLVNKTSLSTRAAKSYVDKFTELNEKTKSYEALLGVYMESIHLQITEALKLVNDNC